MTGIEARPELVSGAAKNLSKYGYGPDRARFLTGDVHQVLNTQDFDADVVLCLGFLYHTLRYNELLTGIRRTNARYLIIDTFSPYMMGPGTYTLQGWTTQPSTGRGFGACVTVTVTS